MDINNQKLIYFNSPNGTHTRIIYNLQKLGLDEKKKICMMYLQEFLKDVFTNSYFEKSKEYDVLYLDEFYEYVFDRVYTEQIVETDKTIEKGIKALLNLVDNGKQIVMASHDNFNSFTKIPKEFKEKVAVYDLDYSIKW